MKKALIHDWYHTNAGAEKCIQSMTNIWNDFDHFALIDFFSDIDRQQVLKGATVNTSFIQNLPFSKKKYRNYLPLFPLAIEQLNLSNYDLIISSSHAVAKGVLTHHQQIHICYMHSPMRYAWDLYYQYLHEANLNRGTKGLLAKIILHYIRIWDINTVNRIDYYVANSQYIANRIKKIYNKNATVIYPPVDTQQFNLETNKEDYYFCVSRMVPYKKMDLIVDAFAQMPQKKLLMAGTGPDFEKIKAKAASNVELLGYVTDDEVKKYMQKAKAFIFAAEEDFGITPVEAQACGTPVIAYGRGGALETIKGNFYIKNIVNQDDTGIFFDEQNLVSLCNAIMCFEKNQNQFNPNKIRENALKFDRKIFEQQFEHYVTEKLNLSVHSK